MKLQVNLLNDLRETIPDSEPDQSGLTFPTGWSSPVLGEGGCVLRVRVWV
jgi:hypothetical protein